MTERPLEERVNHPRTLVIDDEEDVRYLTVRALQKYVGAQVDEAQTLEEAYALMAQGIQYDLVLSDTRLPTGKGYHMLREINGHRAFPVIALSSAGMHYAEHWKNRGAEAYFDKIIINDQVGRVFAAKVKEVLQAYYYPN